MSAPVISPPSSPRSIVIGVAIAPLVLSATGSPGVWAASPLPAGLTLDAAAGTITGTPTTAGVTTTSITATNADGTSAAVSLVWTTATSPVGVGTWSDVEVDVDLGTRQVTLPGIEAGDDGAILRIARGDHFDVLVGFRKYGVLQDLGSSPVVRIGFKEFEGEALKELAGGTATKVGTADGTRYRISLTITPASWSLLADYETDTRTAIVAPVQIEVIQSSKRFCSDSFGVEVIRDSVPD
jgi:hypothetical protein